MSLSSNLTYTLDCFSLRDVTGQSSGNYERVCSFLFIFLVLSGFQESHPLLLGSENTLEV